MSELKKYKKKSVYDAAIERLEYIFDHFSSVYFSVSFGKDSSVMMHLALDIAKRKERLPLNVLYIDFEAQYQFTISHATEMLLRDDVNAYWVCLPLNLRNSVSTYQPFWTPWDKECQDKWVREMPPYSCVIFNEQFFPFFKKHMEFEEFIVKFAEWFSCGKKTACGVAIRTDESLNRFRTIASESKTKYQEKSWTTQVTDTVYNFYPIYDWRTEDIWTAVGRNKWTYNRIYDFMYMAGLSIHQQRICQPYGDDQRKGLDMFHRCEPETWFKVVNRVSGANFGKEHAKSALMGFHKMIKPKEHTWKSYAEFLLNTLPKFEQEWYKQKFKVFFTWYEKQQGIHLDDIPDQADPYLEQHKKVPSWRRICRVLLTNDKLCKGLSFAQTKGQWEKYLALKEEFGE